ncbi:MAG: phosphotransferase family protein [Actinomycetota bacterium]
MAGGEREALAAPLAAVMAPVTGESTVSDLRRLSGGASRETWMFGSGRDRFVLQRARPGALRGLATETAVLRAAARAGVPVPELVVDGSESAALERPFMVVRAVEGETIARKILRDEEYAGARGTLAIQMARAAARISRIDPADVPGLVAEDQLEQYRAVLDATGEAHPVFEVALRWLESNRPPESAPRVVHGDFRLGNMIVDRDGLAAVLDWELAHLGDPLEDLGWMCVRAWRFGGARPAAGLSGYDEILEAWADESGITELGTTVTASALRWWEALGTLKWGIMCILQAQTHLKGVVRSHELAAIGRRVCENEYDLVVLLEELMGG